MTEKFRQIHQVNEAILTFHDLAKPRSYKDPVTGKEGEPKYTSTFMLEPDSEIATDLRKVAQKALKESFPGAEMEDLKRALRKFMKDGDKVADKAKAKAEREKTKKFQEFARGYLVIKASTNKTPTILDESKSEVVAIDRAYYPGVKVCLDITISVYGDEENPGVNAFLNGIMKLSDGKRLMGDTRGKDDMFQNIKGQASAKDPMEDNGEDKEDWED